MSLLALCAVTYRKYTDNGQCHTVCILHQGLCVHAHVCICGCINSYQGLINCQRQERTCNYIYNESSMVHNPQRVCQSCVHVGIVWRFVGDVWIDNGSIYSLDGMCMKLCTVLV